MSGNWTNKPTAIVEFAPAATTTATMFGPRNIPSSGDWVALTIGGVTRLEGFTNQRGRSDKLDQFDPGTATFVLNNQDGLLDETNASSLVYLNKGGAMTPIRFRLTNAYTGTTSTIWTGFITHGWQPSGPGQRVRTVTVRAVEWMGAATNIALPDSAVGSFLAANDPQVWWRGSLTKTTITSANGGYAVDYGFDITAGAHNGYPISTDPVTMTAAIAPGEDADPAMRWHTGARLSTNNNVTPSFTGAWTFVCIFQVIETPVARDLAVARNGSNTGTIKWRVRIGASGAVQAEMFTAGGASTGTATVTNKHNDGKPHIVLATFEPGSGSGIAVTTDLGGNTGGVLGTPSGAGGWIVGGGASTDVRVLVDEWAVMEGLVAWPGTFLANVMDGSTSDLTMWDADQMSVRMDRIAGFVDFITSTFFDPDSIAGVSTVGGYLPQPNLAAAMESTAESLAGGVFTKRDGKILFYGYGDLSNAWFNAGPALFSNKDTATTPIRYSTAGRTGKLLERVINRVTSNGAILATDQPSIDKYGVRVMDLKANPGANAYGYAASIVAARKEHTSELEDLTIEPWGNQTATTWLLEKCELARNVSYEELRPDGATTAVTTTTKAIQSEAWNWTNGSDWSVTLKLA